MPSIQCGTHCLSGVCLATNFHLRWKRATGQHIWGNRCIPYICLTRNKRVSKGWVVLPRVTMSDRGSVTLNRAVLCTCMNVCAWASCFSTLLALGKVCGVVVAFLDFGVFVSCLPSFCLPLVPASFKRKQFLVISLLRPQFEISPHLPLALGVVAAFAGASSSSSELSEELLLFLALVALVG